MLDLLDRLSRIAYWSVGTLAHVAIIVTAAVIVKKIGWN